MNYHFMDIIILHFKNFELFSICWLRVGIYLIISTIKWWNFGNLCPFINFDQLFLLEKPFFLCKMINYYIVYSLTYSYKFPRVINTIYFWTFVIGLKLFCGAPGRVLIFFSFILECCLGYPSVKSRIISWSY